MWANPYFSDLLYALSKLRGSDHGEKIKKLGFSNKKGDQAIAILMMATSLLHGLLQWNKWSIFNKQST